MRSTARDIRCCRSSMVLIGALLACPGAIRAEGPEENARGKISRNFYRIPYANDIEVEIKRDYVNHGVSNNGGATQKAGKMDMAAHSGGLTLVAAADGEVMSASDDLDGCGCHADYSSCANGIRILHANGEMTKYLHIAYQSALVGDGDFVSAGHAIATEGDVGRTCGTSSDPRYTSCLDGEDIPEGTTKCGRHLHWEVYRETTGELLNPIIRNVGGNIFQDDVIYTAGPCFNPCDCSDDEVVSGSTFSGFGTFEVVQANDTITADATTVEDLASMVLHAGNKVTLKPGFRVVAEAYFRAEIGTCGRTAPTSP